MHNLEAAKNTLDQTVYLKLREMIINGEFPPEQVIIQNQLTETLGVSRTPLRKAMAELEMEGLLYRTAKGWYAKKFTLEDMISVFELRAVLEGLACRLIAPVIEDEKVIYLRAIFQSAYQKRQENDKDAYYAADKKFHNFIAEETKDFHLSRSLESCKVIQTSLTQGLYRSPDETYPEHMAIIDALEKKDGDLAEELMRNHVRATITVLKSGDTSIHY
ncbi:GntR family transcriptional regulator [Niallia taxi]|uniref:GntR family transcriptional regulator n=1 Tax=Niallia taxi TaxID=2499688 RepID=UPI00203B7610|nr:GntR family transcriptional regulator [Niallia taxi]MCM3213681.1 GntR family transcriptional regulator [Niallia taxi]MED4039957.1 GntR family transcriptional regulator [Niallia taxi]